MNVDTIKHVSIAGLPILLGGLAKFWLGKEVGAGITKKTVELLSNLFLGIGESATATGLDRVKTDYTTLWDFKKEHPKSLNHDVLNLSKTALTLAITEGVGKPYKKEIETSGKLTEDIEKQIDEKIKELIGATWDFSDNDVIRFVDFKDNSIELLNPKIKLKRICDDLPFDEYFKKHFAEMYRLYFGELLKKPEYNKALIAYQRQVQNLMMEAVSQKNSRLSKKDIEKISEKINGLSCGDITNAIDKVNESLQKIGNRLDEIQDIIEEHFISKTLEIEAIRGSHLACTNAPNISTADLETLKKQAGDYLRFKYRGYSHTIADLNEEDFYYFTRKIDINHILIQGLLIFLENDCNNREENAKLIYDKFNPEQKNWLRENDDLLGICKEFIINNMLVIITPDIRYLFTIGESLDKNRENLNNKYEYIQKCYRITKRIIDLSVFVLLTRLSQTGANIKDDDVKEKINGALKEKTSLKKQIEILHLLLSIHFDLSINDENDPLLTNLLRLKNDFEGNDNFSVIGKELEELQELPADNLNQFDCYRAENILTRFLKHFTFWSNYNPVSIRGIEYHNIKNCDSAFIQYRYPIRTESGKKEEEIINNKASDKQCESNFTHAILLTDKTNEKSLINLCPFIMDKSALNPNDKLLKPFLIYFDHYGDNVLYYNYWKEGRNDNPEYKIWVKEPLSDDENKYSDKNIKRHNINCLLDSFEKIKLIFN